MLTPERLKEMREILNAGIEDEQKVGCQCCSELYQDMVSCFNPQTVRELLDEIDRYREAQERINEDFLLEVITKWKFNWMDVKGTDKADRDNYYRRAFGVDANMQYSLAGMLLKALRGEG